jgi:hypothetical protein
MRGNDLLTSLSRPQIDIIINEEGFDILRRVICGF